MQFTKGKAVDVEVQFISHGQSLHLDLNHVPHVVHGVKCVGLASLARVQPRARRAH